MNMNKFVWIDWLVYTDINKSSLTWRDTYEYTVRYEHTSDKEMWTDSIFLKLLYGTRPNRK